MAEYSPLKQITNGLNFSLKLFLPFPNNRLKNIKEFKEEAISQVFLFLWNFVGVLDQNYVELPNGYN